MSAQVTQLRPPRPIKARHVQLLTHMTAGQAFRVTLQNCLTQIAGNVPSVRARQSEGVHQLRVGLRRLNTALVSFGDPFRIKRVKSLRRQTKAMAKMFGPARDLDVFLDECLGPVMQATQKSQSLILLKERAEDARTKAWDEALEKLESGVLQNFLDEATAASTAKRWEKIGGAPIAETAASTLQNTLAKAHKCARHLDRGEDEDFHRLRLALKRLRYTTEFFECLYQPAVVGAYLNRLKSLQDVLGAMNDAAAARAMLQHLSPEDANEQALCEQSHASDLIAGWHAARSARLTAKALRKWERLRGEQPFWH